MASHEDSDAAGQRIRPIVCLDGVEPGAIERAKDVGEFFWLNLRDGGDTARSAARAGALLGLHELTIEDLEHFGQRAKVEEYEGYVYIVAYGAAPDDDDDRLVEMHIVYSPRFLFTVSRDESPEIYGLHARSGGAKTDGQRVLHGVLDILVDSFAPLLDEIDSEIEAIEEHVFEGRLSEIELQVHAIRRKLVRIARVTHRQSEAYTRLREALRRLPDHNAEEAPYFRDVQDHLIRMTESADSLRERVQGVFEIYLATLDRRQNITMKQFTVIAGVFLPLSVLVGFFGQNFTWMVDRVDSAAAFIALGIALPVVFAAMLLLIIWRGGFFHE